jgi:hypothetical protein
MTCMHNRRGSVLLMAIGMLTILAILTSTFLIISNLDSEETESLSVRAYADPIVDGLAAKAVAQISFDRQAAAAGGPYAAMVANSTGLVSFMDYPHAYPDDNNETADHWLSSQYVPGEGISGPGQLTNLTGPTIVNLATYKIDSGIKFAETATPDATYLNGYDTTGTYVDTDCDGIPDAVLYDTGISSPLSDANTYYAAVRVVDLGAGMCINTAGGWDLSESRYDRPIGSGPEMIDLRTFLDKRSGTSSTSALYPLLNAGDTTGSKGRVGDASPATGGTAANPAPASTKGYYRWCGANMLSPGKPPTGTGGYQPFGIGDEVFFLNACNYMDNMSQFGGRINQIILPLCNATSTPLPDGIRRQLTTINCVSFVARWPDAINTEPLYLNPDLLSTQNYGDLVYNRMKSMLEATGMGKDSGARARMAAHFVANLWAYTANGTGAAKGEPWKYKPGGESFSVFGVRQNVVITQVFARHVRNTAFDPDNPSKDNSAWGYAVEVANPTSDFVDGSTYELEVRPIGGNPVITKVFDELEGSSGASMVPLKAVVYFYGRGAGRASSETKEKFFGVASTGGWVQAENNALDFRKTVPSISVTLYYKIGNERVPIDYVVVGNTGCDLTYDTNVKPTDISGDYVKKAGPSAADVCIHIRRDDRMLATSPTRSVARFNLAMYAESTSSTSTTLGSANGVTETQLTRRSYYGMPVGNRPAFVMPKFSPALYRPRDTAVSASPTARDSLPTDFYFLPSLADMCNVYLAGPISDGTDRPFTTEILREDMSNAFKNRADIGRLPSVKAIDPLAPADFIDAAANAKYPDIPPGYMFHEFFTRTTAQQARTSEKKRIYGMPNINTLPIPSVVANLNYNCAVWWLPWPQENSSTNRLGFWQKAKVYVRSEAVKSIRQYRDLADDCTDRAAWTGITNLRNANGSKIAGFLTPGEVGIPLAKYMDTLLQAGNAAFEQDADYVRARNCLFGYISDCISTRSDVYACYITVQHGRNYSGKRWRYVAVIDRSNVMLPTDKAAVLLVSQLR